MVVARRDGDGRVRGAQSVGNDHVTLPGCPDVHIRLHWNCPHGLDAAISCVTAPHPPPQPLSIIHLPLGPPQAAAFSASVLFNLYTR